MSDTKPTLPELNAPLDLPPSPMDFVIGEPLKQRATPPAQEKPAEPPPPAAAPAPPPAAPDTNVAFAKLAQADAQVRKAQKDLEDAQNRLKQLEPLEQLAQLKDKPLEMLAKLGVSFEDLANKYSETGYPSQEQVFKEQISRLENGINSKFQELEQRELQRQLAEEKAQINHIVDSDERFLLTKLANAQDMVWKTIQTHYNDTRELLSYEQAAAQVETGIQQLVSTFLEHPSAKSRFKLGQPAPVEQRTQQESRQEVRRDMALTNESSTAPSALLPDDFDPVAASADDLIARLATKLRFR